MPRRTAASAGRASAAIGTSRERRAPSSFERQAARLVRFSPRASCSWRASPSRFEPPTGERWAWRSNGGDRPRHPDLAYADAVVAGGGLARLFPGGPEQPRAVLRLRPPRDVVRGGAALRVAGTAETI